MDYFSTFPSQVRVPLDPVVAEALRARAGITPFFQMPLAEGRKGFDAMLALAPKVDDPVGPIEDRMVAGLEGDIPVRIYTPSGEGPFPVLLFIHGGGWVIGSRDSHDDLCRSLCSRAGVRVVSVEYRRAPEHKYPAALHDCFAALKWCAHHFEGSSLAVAGDSAGGNLSAALAIYARDQKGPPLRFQVLIYPVTNHGSEMLSYHENAEGFGLMREGMIHYWNSYLARPEDGREPYASPLGAQDLKGLPPALVLTAHYDVLRDEGEAYAARLRQAGVPVQCTRYLAMNHGFVQFGAVFEQGLVAVNEIAAALRKAFDTSSVRG